MSQELLNNDYITITFDPAQELVTYRRTRKAFANIDVARDSFGQVVNVLAKVDRSRLRMLVDTRDGPLRNDDAFETLMQDTRKSFASFRRVAVLVRTAVGVLQVQRFNRDGIGSGKAHVFQDETEALRWLQEP